MVSPAALLSTALENSDGTYGKDRVLKAAPEVYLARKGMETL